ncbi:MAG: hypothetical protein DRH37_02115 [Deltaproteobacteria bacterium]|nr:MAG: hypothetical protein DRH37_02115 [Deltaproteobacteria bacterium]
MPNGNEVRPNKWSNIIDLYDSGKYSAIWGTYDGNKGVLGVRWNGGDKQGFPNQGKNPTWYIEPDFIVKNILLELLYKVNQDNNSGNIENILQALREFKEK